MNALIDNVRIYNRALSSSEIQQLYYFEINPIPSSLARINLQKAVKPSFSNLTVGASYQLQISGDMSTWTNQGLPFTSTNTDLISPQYWDVGDWAGLFFRLEPSP
jgi:hypothetical protein